MALRWEDKPGTEYGMLGSTIIFRLFLVEGSWEWRLACDLPGESAGSLVAETYPSVGEAKEAARKFVTQWLAAYTEELNRTQRHGQTPDNRTDTSDKERTP